MTAGEHRACTRCGRRFARDAYLALHVGRAHGDTMDDAEKAAFTAARAEEDAYLANVRWHAKALLTVIPGALLVFAIIVLAIVYDASPAIIFLPMPPSLAVLGFLYYMGYDGARRNDGGE